MNKGARFYKCDFQVHSPRDIAWKGHRAVSEEDRRIYAEEFVAKCRELQLNAVAITDHHDLAFFPYIKNAAEVELNTKGELFTETERLVVFPGVELTLSTPSCQAIILIDPDYPTGDLDAILHLLAITPNPASTDRTIETVAISNKVFNTFEELYSLLNSKTSLQGRFIVLPNLNLKGHHSLLRHGNQEHYRSMPCVGGYVDGLLTDEIGYNNVINGTVKEYGFKKVGVFQTSDCRDRDFSTLGNTVSWVKLSTPNAEGLRQACLAKESRLSNSAPEIPQIFITNLDVTNSKFLGFFSVEFNQQYNALIGGRGTGKSTILEYVRWGLCDSANIISDEDERSEIERRTSSLINKTLVPFDGEVRITFILNGVSHVVKRNSVTKQIVLKIGDGEFVQVTDEEIRRILPIQSYSQKQLSSVGVRNEELKRFIEQPIATELSAMKLRIADISNRIKGAYQNVVRKNELQRSIDQYILEKQSLTSQLESLRGTLTGVSIQEQETISKKPKFEFEANLINKANAEFDLVERHISELKAVVAKFPELIQESPHIQNPPLIQAINTARHEKFVEINSIISSLEQALNDETFEIYNDAVSKWEKASMEFNIEYEQALAKTTSNQSQLIEISRIESRIQELDNSINDRSIIVRELGAPDETFNRLRALLHQAHVEKVQILNNQSEAFTKLSNGLIKARIAKTVSEKQIKSLITIALQGTRIQEAKIVTLTELVINAEEPLRKWTHLLEEFRLLAELNFEENPLPEICNLEEATMTPINIQRIAEILTPDKWLELATMELEFSPEFLYETDSSLGDVIPFADASAGQQATALLTVLLNQPGAPLLIDQPEDDIDNRAIEDIVKSIWGAKKKRQLIFTSHNANLVVNGDAELVICCDYRDAGNQTHGTIKAEGTIDSRDVRDEITSVMEGGEKAFRLRKEKYGF